MLGLTFLFQLNEQGRGSSRFGVRSGEVLKNKNTFLVRLS